MITHVYSFLFIMAFIANILILNEIEDRERVNSFKLYRRHLRDSNNPFELSEFNFKKLYRLPKCTIMRIVNMVRPFMQRNRSNGLSVEVQVLTAIRFLAYDSYQRGIGQDCIFPISQPSVSRCVRKFTRVLFKEFVSQYVVFPRTTQDRLRTSNQFQLITGYPGVLGCIDCTHVAIVPPNERAESYKNHKGFHSLNVQMVCDANLRITNVNANFPGRVHDQFIFMASALQTEMNRLHQDRIGEFYLLGDSGYASKRYMLTPILNAERNSPEDRYTNNHCSVRNRIERCFGVLKASWRCLRKDRVLHYDPAQASLIIYACSILHNIAMDNAPNQYLDIDLDNEDVDVFGPIDHVERVNDQRVRERIITNYFT